MSTVLVTLVGAFGALSVLLAFGGQAAGRLSAKGAPYHALNGLGGLALVLSSFAVGAWPSVAVNAIWVGISLAGIAALLRARRPGPVVFEPPTAELRMAAREPATAEYRLPTAELRLPATGEYAV